MKKLLFPAIITLLLTACASNKIASPYQKGSGQTQIVQTKNGLVRGLINDEGNVELFAGIPYAKPPVGNLRWKETQPVENWDGVLEANHFAPVAMQNRNGRFYNFLYHTIIKSNGDRSDYAPMSEDCLYLNIWRPALEEMNSGEGMDSGEEIADSKTPFPVLVYIHGGSLTSGSSYFEAYDGESLAKKGLIVVTVAYRVGIFGYLATEELAKESPHGSTGNYGLLDQIQALKWVKENISAFGGDSNNITIAGESAGSSSVNALCASPLTKGLFRRAIAESSSLVVPTPPHTFRTYKAALEMGQKVMEEYKVSNIEELRQIPAKKLLKTKNIHNSMTVDGYALPETPWKIYQKGQNHEEALLNGFNMDEGMAFIILRSITKKNYIELIKTSPNVIDLEGILSLKEVKTNKDAHRLYTDLFSAVCFNYPHQSWTRTLVAQGRPVYEYCFTKTNPGVSTMHSGEMVYAYGNLDYNGKKIYTQADYELSEIMQNYWANFAKTGNPNGPGLPQWQEASCGKLMELGETRGMIEDPFQPFYQYLTFDLE